jgi:protein gp37
MGKETEISWTDHTFNPWWGCVKVSEACRNCYALSFDKRVGGAHWGVNAPRRFFGEKHWNEPLKWNRDAEKAGVRRRVFCASMADVFEQLPDGHPDTEKMDEARNFLWGVIGETPHLDWLLLTKRPENIGDMIPWSDGKSHNSWKADVSMWPNVWLGTTVEDQNSADKRIPFLLDVPAVVRFLSCEPLLGEVDLSRYLYLDQIFTGGAQHYEVHGWGLGRVGIADPRPHIHWVIAGGESGPNARPMQPDWACGLRDQCQAAGVAFHFKQWGEWASGNTLYWQGWSMPIKNGQPQFDTHLWDTEGKNYSVKVGKKVAGRVLDGRTWDEFPEPSQSTLVSPC